MIENKVTSKLSATVYDYNALNQLFFDSFYSNIDRYNIVKNFNTHTSMNFDDIAKIAKDNWVMIIHPGSPKSMYVYIEEEAHLVLMSFGGQGFCEIEIAGKDIEDINKIGAEYIALFPGDKETVGKVSLDFWSLNETSGGGQSYKKQLSITSWDEAYANYSNSVNIKLQELISVRENDITGGKLILWHGLPGTGKTNAILALANEWKDWCKVEYILDPERFFHNANYMIDVLSRGNQDYDDDDQDEQYRLLVIEDSDEFLKKNAKDVTGQGMSRLLNISDGLIGQGMRCLILITTNEHVDQFHEAVVRPGRCLANIEFTNFTQQEAREWCARKDIPMPPKLANDKNVSLASLYNAYSSRFVIKTENEKVVSTGQYL